MGHFLAVPRPFRAMKEWGIHGACTPEIGTAWDYKADGVLFEGA